MQACKKNIVICALALVGANRIDAATNLQINSNMSSTPQYIMGTANSSFAISTGNIGIGTTTIGSKLQVNGNTAIGYSGSTAAPANGLVISGNTGIGTTTIGSKLQVNGNMAIGYSASTAGPTNGLRMLGNLEVGGSRIAGTTAQIALNAITNTDCILNLNTTTGTQQTGLEFFSGGAQNWYLYTSNTADGQFPLILYNNAKPIQYIRRDGVEFHFGQMRIANDGDWTLPGSYKLAVDGTIGAREVRVTQSAWSDYVFKPDYYLKPLSEVEKHIKANKHLEGIPSEKDVCEKGVAVGEMQSKLLAKIEELTLYVIEQNKKIDAQDRKIQQLTSENTEIIEKIKELAVR